jgi:cell division protein FtsB
MVVRTRLRAIVLPLVLYTVSGSVAAYFVWQALNGERGLKASIEYTRQIADLEKERGGLRAERAHWEHRIGLIRSDEIDRDLVDQEARRLLGRVHPHDLVVMLPGRK